MTELDIAAPQRELERSARMRIWKERYEQTLREMPASDADSVSSWTERRQFPRVTFAAGATVFVHGDALEHEVHDFSAGGLSFFSHVRMAPGKPVLLSARGILSLQVIVVGCDLEEENADLMEYRYRVRAEFTPDVDGYQAFVLAHEIFGRVAPAAPRAVPA